VLLCVLVLVLEALCRYEEFKERARSKVMELWRILGLARRTRATSLCM